MDDNVFEVQIRGDQFGDAPFIVQAANERLLIEKKQAMACLLPFSASSCLPETSGPAARYMPPWPP